MLVEHQPGDEADGREERETQELEAGLEEGKEQEHTAHPAGHGEANTRGAILGTRALGGW
jgi:hypothetical protein